MNRKSDPERAERHRRMFEKGREARAYMQAVIDRHDAHRWAEAKRMDRMRDRRRRLRRILTLGLG